MVAVEKRSVRQLKQPSPSASETELGAQTVVIAFTSFR